LLAQIAWVEAIWAYCDKSVGLELVAILKGTHCRLLTGRIRVKGEDDFGGRTIGA